MNDIDDSVQGKMIELWDCVYSIILDKKEKYFKKAKIWKVILGIKKTFLE